MTNVNTMVERLGDENYRGAFQHLRSWSELDQMHTEAAALIRSQQEEIAVLRKALTSIKSIGLARSEPMRDRIEDMIFHAEVTLSDISARTAGRREG